jgi:hypothetical protein
MIVADHFTVMLDVVTAIGASIAEDERRLAALLERARIAEGEGARDEVAALALVPDLYDTGWLWDEVTIPLPLMPGCADRCADRGADGCELPCRAARPSA